MGSALLSRDEVEALHPEALVLLDIQAQHVAARDDVHFIAVANKRTPRRKLHARTMDRGVRVYFDERVNVWVRYSCGVSSMPRREVCRPYCVAPMPLDPQPTTTTSFAEIMNSEYVKSMVEMYEAEPAWAMWFK